MRKFIPCLLALASLFLTPALAQAAFVTLADNIGQAEFQAAFTTNVDWQAQAFTTTATAYTLADVALPLCNSTATTGTFFLSIYSTGAGGRPGGKVADVRTGIDAETLGLTTARYDVSGLNIALSASTQYYLVVGGADLIGSGIEWSYTESTAGIGFPSAYTSSVDGGNTWVSPSVELPSMMRIQASGSASVPEPSTFVLLSVSLGVVGFVRRKMVKREEGKDQTGNC